MRNFLWCYYRQLITSLVVEKCKMQQRMQYSLNIILVQGFGPLKIKITQFPDGLRLHGRLEVAYQG